MERFEVIKPTAVLTTYVKHYWILESDDVSGTQRIIPTGNVELLFHRGCQMICNGGMVPRASVSGQAITHVDLSATGPVNMIVVVFHPFAAKAFFDMPVNELSEISLSADEINDKSLRELEDRILNTAEDVACISLIESFLIGRLHPFKEYNYERMLAAVNTINYGNGNISVSRLAEKVCLGKKQFERIFSEHVGATPKEFMRIVRFHKALFLMQHNPSISFTRLAYESGYYDQSHMINEFKQFSGYTPGEYISVCAPYSDYFSY